MTTPEQAHPVSIGPDAAGVTRVRCTTCDVEIADQSMWDGVDGDATSVLVGLIEAHRNETTTTEGH